MSDNTWIRLLGDRVGNLEKAEDDHLARIKDLEAELSNARVQGLENEKEIVTLKLEMQALKGKFYDHFHVDHTGERTSSATRKHL